jgi:hypothetical protein
MDNLGVARGDARPDGRGRLQNQHILADARKSRRDRQTYRTRSYDDNVNVH